LRSDIAVPIPTAPTITVAICSKDRWDWVDRLLESLLRDTGGDRPDILVVDNASSHDRLREVAEARGVRYVREGLAGLDFARNRAVREARGEVVAFLDDDVTVEPGWYANLRRVWAENPDAGCVTGLVLPMLLDTEAQILFEARGGFRRGFLPKRFGPKHFSLWFHPCDTGRLGAGANMSIRKALVDRIGGFDEALDTGRPLPGGGDLDIFFRLLRAGGMHIYEPQVAVRHEHRREMAVLSRQYYTWGLGFAAFLNKAYRTDPEMRPRLRGLVVYWHKYQLVRLLSRLVRRDPTPTGMILREIWGGWVGFAGEYRRSQARIAAIRKAAQV
jgi:GT2 family glycosyltransferase